MDFVDPKDFEKKADSQDRSNGHPTLYFDFDHFVFDVNHLDDDKADTNGDAMDNPTLHLDLAHFEQDENFVDLK